jgi:hypothetical protein
MNNLLERRLRSGQTLRYHTTPHLGAGQTVSEHAWRTTVLMHTLWPDIVTLRAVMYALYHDAAEQTLGDLPAPAKWNYADLADAYSVAEKQIEQELGVPDDLTPDEQHICKMADTLELVDYVAHRIMRGDHSYEARNIYWNGRKHLLLKYGKNVLFGPAEQYLAQLHAQVVRVCPTAISHP